MGKSAMACLLVFMTGVPLFAQEEPGDASRPPAPLADRFDFWIKGQAMLFQNFFQASESAEEEDVLAGEAQVGARVRPAADLPLSIYASYNYRIYDDESLDTANGFRVGLGLQGRVHMADVYYDKQNDLPTFDVGDVFDRADVETVNAEYALRFTRDWQVSAEAMLQDQTYDMTPSRNNEFEAFGGAVRYRGWRKFSPEVGFMTGTRDVADDSLSYDQDDLYLQIRSALTPELYTSIRYRLRERAYTTDVSGFGRNDDRRQISGYADYRLTSQWTLNLYGSWETTESTILGRDFETALWIAGLTYNF